MKLIPLCLLVLLSACQKEHAEYRYTPKYHKGDLVQYRKDIQHDYAAPGTRMWDIPQPLTIDSAYYNPTWRDNWYFCTDAKGVKHSAIDELSLQGWRGKLER